MINKQQLQKRKQTISKKFLAFLLISSLLVVSEQVASHRTRIQPRVQWTVYDSRVVVVLTVARGRLQPRVARVSRETILAVIHLGVGCRRHVLVTGDGRSRVGGKCKALIGRDRFALD